MECFRRTRAKIENPPAVLNIRDRIRFECMNQIREFHGITDKENFQVIAYKIPVSIFRIKFNGKSPWVT